MKWTIAFAGLLALSGCGGSMESQGNDDGSSEEDINGYGPFSFGMSFDQVLAAKPSGMFNPVSIAKCPDVLALRGCLLTQRADGLDDVTEGSIPYEIAATIGRDDQLYEIAFFYEPDASLSREECLEVLDRTIGWSWPDASELEAQTELTGNYVWREAPNGVRYPVSENGDFATVFAAETEGAVGSSYYAYYLTMDSGPRCRVSMSFSVHSDSPHQFD